MRVAIIINPDAGVHRSGAVAARQALAHDVLRTTGMDGQVVVSEGRGRGREVTRAMVEEGFDTFVVWGGDGTINEVASQLVPHGIPLGIVPAGSGNGLARELGLDWNPRRALDTALRGRVRRIDAGELAGHLFFNVAGIGLDAKLALAFDARKQRGLRGYAASLLHELWAYNPGCYTVTTDGSTTDGLAINRKALLIALANTRQYGNRAVIAPLAKPDDGLLELVVVPPLSPVLTLWHASRLFTRTVHRLPGAVMHSVRGGRIAGDGPLTFHVDGEVVVGPSTLSVRVHPGVLAVRVPT